MSDSDPASTDRRFERARFKSLPPIEVDCSGWDGEIPDDLWTTGKFEASHRAVTSIEVDLTQAPIDQGPMELTGDDLESRPVDVNDSEALTGHDELDVGKRINSSKSAVVTQRVRKLNSELEEMSTEQILTFLRMEPRLTEMEKAEVRAVLTRVLKKLISLQAEAIEVLGRFNPFGSGENS